MPLTRDEVTWCYQTILHRSPENIDVINNFVAQVPDLTTLVNIFLASNEYRLRVGATVLDGYVYDVNQATQTAALAILKKLEPVSITGHRKIRIGGAGDGGYVMLDEFQDVEAAYSLGIKDDVTWDLDIAKRNIPVFQYDHTIDALPAQHQLFHWFKTGIAAAPAAGYDTLQNLIEKNGHQNSKNLLLKCDIEGAEWDMFGLIPQKRLDQFGQIVAEFHGWQEIHRAEFAAIVERAVSKLTASHRLVHVHGNNNSALAIVGGIALPASMEMTFIRTAGRPFTRCEETFPGALDTPCWPHRADYHLGTFRFS